MLDTRLMCFYFTHSFLNRSAFHLDEPLFATPNVKDCFHLFASVENQTFEFYHFSQFNLHFNLDYVRWPNRWSLHYCHPWLKTRGIDIGWNTPCYGTYGCDSTSVSSLLQTSWRPIQVSFYVTQAIGYDTPNLSSMVITHARLQLAAGGADTMNRVRFSYICRALGHLS